MSFKEQLRRAELVLRHVFKTEQTDDVYKPRGALAFRRAGWDNSANVQGHGVEIPAFRWEHFVLKMWGYCRANKYCTNL